MILYYIILFFLFYVIVYHIICLYHIIFFLIYLCVYIRIYTHCYIPIARIPIVYGKHGTYIFTYIISYVHKLVAAKIAQPRDGRECNDDPSWW